MKFLKNIIPILAIIFGLFLFLARFNLSASWSVIEFIYKIIPTDAVIINADKFISWGLHLWYIPISFVLAGIIGLVIVNKRYNVKFHVNRRRYDRSSFGFGSIFNFMRTHKLLILLLLAIVLVFTIKLEAWAWLAIGVFAVAILPPIIMFIIYNVIAKVIWRR